VSKVLHQDFHQENKLVFYIIPTSLKKLSILKQQKEKMKMMMNLPTSLKKLSILKQQKEKMKMMMNWIKF